LINNVSLLDRATHEEVRRLIACAQLQSIRFVKFALSLDLQEGSSAEEVELSTSAKSTGRLSASGMTLIFDLRVRGKSRERYVIDIVGRIEAAYNLPDSEPPTDQQMKAFAKTNGMLNIWPYWREYVQSATLRAGLPPLTLPLFRVMHETAAK
jgi:preprotein translocase subunit SecB